MSPFIHFMCTYLLLSISRTVEQLSFTAASPAPSSSPITCNTASGCEITCTGDDACNGATFTSSSASYLTITASGAFVLADATINCPSNAECTIISIGSDALNDATINCGTNGVCDVTTRGDNPSSGAVDINAESSTKLITTGDGGYESLYAIIRCPRSQPKPSCIIRLRSDSSPYWSSTLGERIMALTWIYIDSADDLEFQCDADTNWNALYHADTNHIYSYTDDKVECDMTHSYSASDYFGTNSFTCIYKLYGTEYNLLRNTKCVPWPTDAPTQHPSVSPITSRPSTSPTNRPSNVPIKSPTMNPSLSPTALPTTFPSHVPTLTPTKQPTNDPSSLPSTYPTVSPTTGFPTATPSKLPSKTPSKSPEKGLVLEIGEPSTSPTELPTYHTTTGTTQNKEANESSTDGQSQLFNPMILSILVMVGGCLILCLIISIIFVLRYLYKGDHKQNMNSVKNARIIAKEAQENIQHKQAYVEEITDNPAQNRESRVENVVVDDYMEKENDKYMDTITKEIYDVMHGANVNSNVNAINEDAYHLEVDLEEEEKADTETHQNAEESRTDITGHGALIRQPSNNPSVKSDLLFLENMLDMVTDDGILQDEFEVHSDTDSLDGDTDGDTIEEDDVTEEGPDIEDVMIEKHETVGSVVEKHETIGSITAVEKEKRLDPNDIKYCVCKNVTLFSFCV
eukprot:999787_1